MGNWLPSEVRDATLRFGAPPGQAEVLSGAVVRAAHLLGLTQAELSRVLGVSPATASRLARGAGLDPASKEGELGLLFIRAFRSLDALVGGDDRAAREWWHAENFHLGGVPAELARKVVGLVQVVQYLDAMRGAQ